MMGEAGICPEDEAAMREAALLGRLVPDHKTVADFRKGSGHAIRKMCARFVELCREIGLLATASVAIDGSKFKAVNNRDRNLTRAKVERRRAQLEESVARYLSQLDTTDRQEPSEALAMKTTRLKEKLAKRERRCSASMVSRRERWLRPISMRQRRERLSILRHNQGKEGRNPLPDKDAETGRWRDGSPRPRPQSHAGHEHHGARTARGSDQGLDSASLAGPKQSLQPPRENRPCRTAPLRNRFYTVKTQSGRSVSPAGRSAMGRLC
jgi:ribosomal protein L14E/L6E/L27E